MASDPHLPREVLVDELYEALHSRALRELGKRSRLEATDLVHQAWVRLAKVEQFEKMTRSEFLAICATLMRRIATDEGRRRLVERRDPERITLSGLPVHDQDGHLDVLALDQALDELANIDERWSRVVELRFFGGLTGEEIGEVMGLSRRSVTREWNLARAWLKRRLG